MSWPRKKVSELCIFAVDCINKTAPTVDNETKYKMIRTTNVKDGFVYLDHVSYVTEETFLKWTRRSRPQYGDVVLTREAPVGQVGRFTSSDENVFLGQRLFHYRPDPDLLDWNFLAYVLMSREVQGRLQGMGFGATVNHIRVGDAEHLEIPCPPTHIQRKIGSILSCYDDLIENNRRRIQLLEESARMLYEEWFVRLRFPGHKHVKVVNGVPEGWERKTLGEVSAFISRGITPSYDDSASGLVINQKCVRNHFVESSLGRYQAKTVPQIKQLQYGDVLINSTGTGTLGRVAQYFECIENCTVDSHVTIARPMSKKYMVYYGFVILSNEELLAKAGRGSTNQTELAKAIIEDIPFIKPSVTLLTQFEEFAIDIKQQIQIIASQNRKLAQARDLLLPKLMSGDVAV